MKLMPVIRGVVRHACKRAWILRARWTEEDLVQEAFLRSMLRLEEFGGRSSLKTWVTSTANNHLMSMARKAKIRPPAAGDAVLAKPSRENPTKQVLLRTATSDLLTSLKANPSEVRHGWEVLNVMLWNGGDLSRTALALGLHTGEPWTTEKVRHVIYRIQSTTQGRALCVALGLLTDDSTGD